MPVTAIPFDPDLPSKPEVIRIAQAVGMDPEIVAIRLLSFWSRVAAHTTTGLLAGLDIAAAALLHPKITEVFLWAVVDVGWLKETAEGVTITNFEFWHGKKPLKLKGKAPKKPKKEAVEFDPLKATIPSEINTPEFVAAWNKWVVFRKDKRQPLTKHSVPMQLKKLAAWGEERAIASIEQSIAHDYQGLFQPKDDASGHRGVVRPDSRVRGSKGAYADRDDTWMFGPQTESGSDEASSAGSPSAD